MNDLDARLAAALHEDSPPPRDAIFRVDVLARLERLRFRRRVTVTVASTFVVAVLVAVNAPAIEAWMATDVLRLGIVALVAAVALFALPAALVDAPSGVRTLVRAFGRWLYP
jgi:hypothetical protein